MLRLIVIFFFITVRCAAQDDYFLTLRNDVVNLRQGPSFEYPVKISYKKKYLPVLIQDQSENFRKIRDHENNSGWIHISQLSPKKAAITIYENTVLFTKPSIFSKPKVMIDKGRLCEIKKCKNEWCKIKTGNFQGWVKKNSLWGRL